MNTITSTPLRTLVAGAILSALSLSFATVSSAEERTTPPQVTVKFGDLDVSTSQGAGDVPPLSVAQGFGVVRHCNGLGGQVLCVLGGRQPAE